VKPKNIFKIDRLPSDDDGELFEDLFSNQKLRIKRIISTGQVTPQGTWYDQEENEWVILLQGSASIEFENGDLEKLSAGDYLHLPAGKKHRVAFTSKNPPCIWLAVFYGD